MKQYPLHADARNEETNFDLLSDLYAAQREVVNAQGGPILVIAGAGSGKTRTLTHRVARLVYEGIPADRILLCTFTNKAAREMVIRVERLLRKSADTLWAGTFHHIANRILRQHSHLLDFGINFTILDREDSAQLIDESIHELGFGQSNMRFPKGRALLGVFGYCRSTERTLENTIAHQHPKFEPILAEINDVWKRYQERKHRLNMMDFDDLLFYWHQILTEFPEVHARYADQFLHVLVDEYQDTNPIQATIIDQIARTHRNLTVVGDDAQSIYSFRGADCRNILQFPERYPDCRTFYLTENYRSRPEILAVSNRVIAYNTYQFPKDLQATRSSGAKPITVIAEDARQEADFVAQRIRELHDEGVVLHEMAVLYRAHNHSLDLQLALQHHNIPFVVRSGLRFFEKAHVKDMVAFLRIVHNLRDELAWRRILPLFPGIGQASINKVWQRLEETDFEVNKLTSKDWLDKMPKNGRTSLQWLVRLLLEGLELRDKPAEILRMFLEQEYRDHLEHTYEDAADRSEDIARLATYATDHAHIREFLDEMMLLGDIDASMEPREEENDGDALVLSTVHQAKGLEWKIVFILDVTETSFPLYLALEEDGLEEERRLFYVATTRAKEQLYLIFRRMFQHRQWGWRRAKPSRFLHEILQPAASAKSPPEGNLDDFLKKADQHPLLEVWQIDEAAHDADDIDDG